VLDHLEAARDIERAVPVRERAVSVDGIAADPFVPEEFGEEITGARPVSAAKRSPTIFEKYPSPAPTSTTRAPPRTYGITSAKTLSFVL
jgi:hypothetical protein